MSNPNEARRATAEISFAGTPITADISPYLLSVQYTDVEDGEADDLQIRLQDRDGIWQEHWMRDIVSAAASGGALGVSHRKVDPATHTVNATIGLRVRAGPGTGFEILEVLPYGAPVRVDSTAKGWAHIQHGRREAYVSARYLTKIKPESQPSGLRISATIIRKNWEGGGKDAVLDCGSFEVDEIESSGLPSVLTIRATALPYSAAIRQAPRSKAWESYTLYGIGMEIAKRNGMGCLYLAQRNPMLPRVEQYKQSDISFLTRISKTAGISVKVTGNLVVLYDEYANGTAPVLTIRKGDGQYEDDYSLRIGKAETQYTSCRVSYVTTHGRLIEATAFVEDYDPERSGNQKLDISAKVQSVGQAEELAKNYLRRHNRLAQTAFFTLPGNPAVNAGQTITLIGWGPWDGPYAVATAVHTVDGNNGYTTRITLRKKGI